MQLHQECCPSVLCAPLVVILAHLLAPAAGQISPDHSQKQTVFHINPLSAGTVPVNQNTGDLHGDLSFYLDQFLLPLECANKSKDIRSVIDCSNLERAAADIVATQVDLEIDDRFTHYSACNLCNNSDPFTHQPCRQQHGEYVCDCFSPLKRLACNPGRVGRENVSEALAPPVPGPSCKAALHRSCGSEEESRDGCLKCVEHHFLQLKLAGCSFREMFFFCGPAFGVGCGPDSPAWACWRWNLIRKAGGNWFSTLQDGMCSDGSQPGTCSWRVLQSRTINETCLRNTLADSIEKWNANCFHACGLRNLTSECWITCAMEGVLGPEAARTTSEPLSGMPVSELEMAWKQAFAPQTEGGCPTVDMRAVDLARAISDPAVMSLQDILL
mmetsp:Transcript_57672/g.106621  ORF Transcript_57672/g.106621 Transcript_57672/m.106621 type:complete len:385 (+) Transcript_57672:40-1194(+)